MKENALSQPKNQMVSIDILKITCMFIIIILHINNHGKTLEISGGGLDSMGATNIMLRSC